MPITLAVTGRSTIIVLARRPRRIMQLHQRQFLPYRDGAPTIHSLAGASASRYALARLQSVVCCCSFPTNSAGCVVDRHVLVTTDRSVGLVEHADSQYWLLRLGSDDLSREDVEIVASGVIEAPGDRDRAAIAYLEREKLYLQLAPLSPANEARSTMSSPHRPPTPTTPSKKKDPLHAMGPSSTMRFELSAAPSMVMSTKALSTAGAEVFYGVILFRSQSMVAFGYVDDSVNTTNPSAQVHDVDSGCCFAWAVCGHGLTLDSCTYVCCNSSASA